MNYESIIAQLNQFFSPDSLGGFSLDFIFNDKYFGLELAILAFLIFWPLFLSTWVYWRNEVFKEDLKWVLLEIKVPREIDKSPRAMEQVLAALHALRNEPVDLQEKYWDGEVTRWISLEIASFGGEIHFYVRIYYKQRDILEAAFFAFYKDVELVEVDDYMDKLPATMPEVYQQGYDIWGTELILARESAYPIKSYIDFEAIEEEQQVDPISSFLEVLAQVKPEQTIVLQFLISGARAEWNTKWKGLVEKLNQMKKEGSPASAASTTDFPGGPLPAFGVKPQKQDELRTFTRSFFRTPGETDILKAVERNLAKPAFNTLIRYIYFSPKSIYYDSFPRRGILSAFNQYGTLDLNRFMRNEKVSTRVKIWNSPYIFPKTRREIRKQRLLYNYRKRELPPETIMGKILTSSIFMWNIHNKMPELNIESLATLFHPPAAYVLTAPHMMRVESRKTGPPAGLAIFGEEDSIEKLK